LVNREKDFILLNSIGFVWYLSVGTLDDIYQVVSGQKEKKDNE